MNLWINVRFSDTLKTHSLHIKYVNKVFCYLMIFGDDVISWFCILTSVRRHVIPMLCLGKNLPLHFSGITCKNRQNISSFFVSSSFFVYYYAKISSCPFSHTNLILSIIIHIVLLFFFDFLYIKMCTESK
jgi:hypothetical protein